MNQSIKLVLLSAFATAVLSACGGGGGPNLSYWAVGCKAASKNGGTWTDSKTGAVITANECNNTWFDNNGNPCSLIDDSLGGLPGALANKLSPSCKWKITGDKVKLSEDPAWPNATAFTVTVVNDQYCVLYNTGLNGIQYCADWSNQTYTYWTSNATSLKYDYPSGVVVNKAGSADRYSNDIFSLADKETKKMMSQKAADLARSGIPSDAANQIAKRVVLETMVKGTYTDTQIIEMEALNLAGVPRDVTQGIIRDAKAGNMSAAMEGVGKAAEAAGQHFGIPADKMLKIINDQMSN